MRRAGNARRRRGLLDEEGGQCEEKEMVVGYRRRWLWAIEGDGCGL